MKKLTREEIIIELDQYYEAAGFKGIKYRELEDMNQIELERLYKETFKEEFSNDVSKDNYDPETIVEFKSKDFKDEIRRLCNIKSDEIRWKDIIYCEEIDLYELNSMINITEDLKWFLNLKKLDLSHANEAFGDISVFKNLVYLESLRLGSIFSMRSHNINITGDLDSLKNLKLLKKLDLSYTNVSGDLDSLKNLKLLKKLDLSSTNVSGDLDSLKNLKLLKELDLSSTNVSGDISSLKTLTNLELLSLSYTKASGHVGSLRHIKSLYTLAVDDTEILGEETIRKYNVDVKKENFEKRCNLLIDSIMKHGYCESRPNTKDIIANKLDFQSGSKSYEFAELVIGDTYVPNEYDDNFYSGWLYGYLMFVISNSNIEEIILECDGFFSYLAIQEILEILEDMAEKNSELERYINDSSFLELKLNIGKILGVLSVEEEDYFDIGIMGEENKRLTDWRRIDDIYLIGHLLEEVSNNLLRIDGCEILSKDLQELSESIIPENTLKNEDEMA